MAVNKVFYRNPHNYDLVEASNETALDQRGQESLTVQDPDGETDINTIVSRFGLTGKFPENPRVPGYGDFTHITDYASALAAVNQAQEGFMEYPAELRARFENNPQLFLEFCSQEENREEMRKLGLLNQVEVPTPPTPPEPPAPGTPPKA